MEKSIETSIQQRVVPAAEILIVTDDETSVEPLRRLLDSAGYLNSMVLGDASGIDALRRSPRYHLVVLDFAVPEDALGSLERWRRRADGDGDGKTAPVTMAGPPEVAQHALDAGARAFFAKPFDATDALARIGKLISLRLFELGGRERAHTLRRGTGQRFRSRRRMDALISVTATLMSGDTLVHAAPKLLEAIGEALDWVVGGFWIADGNGETLRCIAFWHRESFPVPRLEEMSRCMAYPAGVGVPGCVMEAGAPVWFSDLRDAPHCPRAEVARAEGLNGAFSFPASNAGKVLAVLEFYSAGVQEPDAAQQTMMEATGNLVAQCIVRLQTEAALQRERDFLATLLENVSEGIVACDVHGTLSLFNRAARELHALPPMPLAADEWARHYSLFLSDGKTPMQKADIPLFRALGGERVRNAEMVVAAAGSPPLHLVCNGQAIVTASGEQLGAVVAMHDISLQVQQQSKIVRLGRLHAVSSSINAAVLRLHDREQLFREACRIAVEQGNVSMAWIGVAESSGDLPVRVARFPAQGADEDAASRVASQSAAMSALRDRRVVVIDDVHGNDLPQRLRSAGPAALRSVVALPLVVEGEAIAVFVFHYAEPAGFDADELRLLDNLAADISFSLEHTAKEERLTYVAYYDTLTGLANRRLFFDRLGLMLATAASEQSVLAVLVLDPQRFRNINHTLGRRAGDLFLKQLAERLRRTLGAQPTLARIGPDQFAVAVSDLDATELALLVEGWAEVLHLDPYTIDAVELRVAVRIGAALYPADGSDADTLFRNAEAALQQAKDTAAVAVFYSQEMNARVAAHLHLESRLRLAIERKQFLLHYQPKVDMRSREIIGLEALVRWSDPQRGLISPLDFIPVLEQTGMILEVGRWVLSQAVVDRQLWHEQGLEVPRVAVNVSNFQLRRADFVDTTRDVLESGDPLPRGLDLEITESLIMEDPAGGIKKLGRLRESGMRIYMDDFGTGYSSLGQLADLPVDALKIDRAFITRMQDHEQGTMIVSTIISLAHSLQIGVVAEGVETEAQAALLLSLGCYEGQGYLFSKPLAAADMALLLPKRRLDASQAEMPLH